MANVMDEKSDRISKLPDVLIQNILSKIPMKDAVRTSLLSKKWRYFWKSILNLDFDDEFWNSIPNKNSEDKKRLGQKRLEFVGIVNQLLIHHEGPKLLRFRLYFYPGQKHHSYAERWLKTAATKEVQEVDLDFYMESGKHFMVPSPIFECRSMLSLKLNYCEVRFPSDFKFSCSLRTLHLKQVMITDNVMGTLLSNSSLLESLFLIDCLKLEHLKTPLPAPRLKILKVVNSWDLESIEINAPNLQSLLYSGHHTQFFLKDITGLQHAVLDTGERPGDGRVIIEEDPRVLLSKFSHVKILLLSAYFLQIVYAGRFIYRHVPVTVTLHNLKELQMSIEGIKGLHVTSITYLLRMCPGLEKFFLDVDDTKLDFRPDNPWLFDILNPNDEIDVFDCSLDHLKFVEFKGFTATMFEIMLVRIILTNARALKTMVLIHPPNYKVGHILENIMWALQQKYDVCSTVPPSSVTNMLAIFATASPKPKILLLPSAQSRRFIFNM